MKRALIIVSFAFVGCTPTFLESGRYACEHGQPDQCPGQWRCGLEGYCHQLGNTTVAWRCETNDDCEAKFVCGIAKSGEFRECHDPAAPQDWPCEVPADCVSGWQCGLSSSGDSRQCHDPAAPQDWPCEVPADCVGGWQCGLSSSGDSRQCHDPAAPRSFRCEVAGDCVGGWSCGLSTSRDHRECHDPAAPRAFACADDSDCLAGWRCGTELTCVDPSADALGLTPQALVDGGTHLNSLTSKSPVSLLSVSQFYAQDPGSGRGNLAFVQDGHLRARSLDLGTRKSIDYDLGTEIPLAVIAHGSRGFSSDTFSPDDLERVTVAWPDAGITTFTFADGGLDHSYETSVFPVDRLSQGSTIGTQVPSIVAFPSGATPGRLGYPTYGLLRGDTYREVDLYPQQSNTTPFHEVPGNKISSMTSLRHSDDLECVYLVDERGLWVSQRGYGGLDSWDFEPVSLDRFEQTVCGASTQPRIKSVSSLDDRWLAVTASTPGGPVQVAMLDVVRTWTNRAVSSSGDVYCVSFFDLPCETSDRLRADVSYGPCLACPAGSTFQKLATVASATPGVAPELEVSCGQPNGASSIFHLARNGAASDCTRTLVSGESAFFAERAPVAGLPAPGVSSWAGSTGQIWYGASASQLASFTFDRAASGVVRRGSGTNEILAFTSRVIGTPTPGVGLISAPSTMLAASVQHAPSLAISGAQVVDLTGTGALSEARPLAFANVTSLNSPTTAVLTRVGPQGTPLVIITGGTTLYVGDLTGVISTPGLPVALTQRLTTIEPVSSLAFPAVQPTGAAFAAGYAVTGSNLVRVVADAQTRWRTEAVPLPAQLVPRSTWFDGSKGRVGFQDGSVFSLPSRVRLAPPLPGNEAVDYAQACGQQLALAPTGLFRLESSATEPVGTWQAVALPGALQGLDFTEGRVHGVDNEVFVFTRLGEAARITFAGCPG